MLPEFWSLEPFPEDCQLWRTVPHDTAVPRASFLGGERGRRSSSSFVPASRFVRVLVVSVVVVVVVG